jgi:hypothetical protein
MASFAEGFVVEVSPSNVVQTSGSIILVQSLTADAQEPDIATISIDTAPIIGDEEISLESDIDVVLRQGTRLHFGADVVVVSSNTELEADTPVLVPVEELTVVPTGTAETWGLLRLLSPQALPLTSDSTNVDRKDYTFGLQGSEVKTRVNLNSSVQIINQVTDRAFWEVVHPAGLGSNNIFSMIVTNAEHAFGAAQVTSLTDDNALDEISRPSFDLLFQAPFARVGQYAYLPTNQQTALNEVRKLAGLSLLS